jgi:hypothetical protein
MTMHRLLSTLLAVLVVGQFGVTSADAARHKKIKAAPAQAAPVYTQPAGHPPYRPAWMAPQQCVTDDGYGRFLPCDVGDAR